MRRSPTCRLVSLNVPEASTATYASNPLPTAVMAGKSGADSREMPAKISFLRPVDSMARATRASSNALTDERSMISMPGSASTSSGNVGPHMLSRAVVVTMIGSFSAFAALARVSVAAKKGTILAVETEPEVRLRYGLWQHVEGAEFDLTRAWVAVRQLLLPCGNS